jgi:CheY-like chemotaxis protein
LSSEAIGSRPNFSSLTFLVVDDHEDGRMVLSEVLRACGATVLEASNIPTAKAYFRTRKLDLVVTDLALPGEDGAMFLKWLREQPREQGGGVAAVAVTAYYEDYPPTAIAGWAAYLQKPVELGHFVQTIAAILGIPRGAVPDTQSNRLDHR